MKVGALGIKKKVRILTHLRLNYKQMKQVDIFKQKIFTGDKKQMLFFWKAIKNMNKYISVFLIFFLNACISPSGYLSSDKETVKSIGAVGFRLIGASFIPAVFSLDRKSVV